MSVNITINTVGDSVAVLYFQDGSQVVVPVNTEQSFQLVDNGFVTISDVADPDAAEHPPKPGEEFLRKMIAFWQAVLDKIRQPTATPV